MGRRREVENVNVFGMFRNFLIEEFDDFVTCYQSLDAKDKVNVYTKVAGLIAPKIAVLVDDVGPAKIELEEVTGTQDAQVVEDENNEQDDDTNSGEGSRLLIP